jgi:hypothetical protein
MQRNNAEATVEKAPVWPVFSAVCDVHILGER